MFPQVSAVNELRLSSIANRATAGAASAGGVDGNMKHLPLLALTMGDPCGVGPEIIAKALMDSSVATRCRSLVIGAPEWMQRGIDAVQGCKLTVKHVDSPEDAIYGGDVVNVYSPLKYDMSKIVQGQVGAEGGKCAAEWVISAVELCMAERCDGIVTAPLNKEAMHLAGYKFGGHTELLAKHSGATASRLCLASDKLNVVHATCHVRNQLSAA
jgi:4-hydroxythreonine-4-phosphate dehydrogenase